jgi:hypothetical protein
LKNGGFVLLPNQQAAGFVQFALLQPKFHRRP